jgi:hypothetical protein
MRGEGELKKHEAGERLTQRQMILAKCFECCGNYADGREDCAIPECPLYPMMPYGSIRRAATSRKMKQRPPLEGKKG